MFIDKFVLLVVLCGLVKVGAAHSPACMCREILEVEDEDTRPIDATLEAIRYASRRWPNKTMHINVTGVHAKFHDRVFEAMEYLSNVTCIKYLKATMPSSGPEVDLVSDIGCASYVGYRGVEHQNLTMWSTCFYSIGIIVHELLHASGLYHHHSRPDRNSYVFINESNIILDQIHNYHMVKGYHGFLSTMGVPYDYRSIMHYPKSGFDKDSNYPVISVLGNHPIEIGQRLAASRTDIATINRLYECWDHYLGDDIPGAIPYKEWHDSRMLDFAKVRSEHLTDADKVY